MNSCLKYFSACLLALLSQAAFAQSAPTLGAASSFTVLSAADNGGGAVTCTDSAISGDVGSSGQPASVVRTRCTISGAVVAPVPAQVVTAFDDAYAALALETCTQTFTQDAFTDTALSLTPGVYCFPAAATFTRTTLTLVGSSSDIWIFKIGTAAPGALTGTGFSVLLDGAQACNVYWWVDAAVTMTTSGFQGTILAGAGITATGLANPTTTFNGDALAKAAVTLTNFTVIGCENGISNPPPVKQRCNQGVGNGPENCDPGNSNQDDFGSNPFTGSPRTNDELGGTPRNPGRRGGNK